MRVLNKIITGFSKELIAEISPHVAKVVRPVIKAPMILILYVAGVMTGLNLTAFTLVGELL